MYGNTKNRSKRNIWLAVFGLLIPFGAGLGVGLGSENAVEGLAAGLGAWAAIVLMYGDHSHHRTVRENHHVAWGVVLGTVIGAGFGIVIGVAIGNLAFFSIGVGIGLFVGLLIGQALNERGEKSS